MIRKEKVNIFRVIPILFIVIITCATTLFFCFLNQFYPDDWMCVLFLDAVFLLILIFELEYERKRKMIANNTTTTFFTVALGYTICCIIAMFFPFLPEFFCPVALLPILMSAMSNETIGIVTGIYLNLLFGLICSGNYYELICYCLLTLFSGILAKAMKKPGFQLHISIILLCISLFLPSIFYYWNYKEVENRIFFYGLACGVVTAVISQTVYKKLQTFTEREIHNRLLRIMEDDFPQVNDLQSYLPAEYRHAKKVSEVAKKCAKALGFGELFCAASGFYYRLGKWQGEPHVANGVETALQLHFPGEMVQLLSEYYGEDTLPQTPESALIQMVDAVAVKMTALYQNVGQSKRNQELIIYQILNEYSNSGLYDECGMSMNQFVKVREILVKEEWAT